MSEYIVCPYCYNPLSQSEYVKVVRCRDCKEYNTELYKHISCELLGRYVDTNDFCSWGVKK